MRKLCTILAILLVLCSAGCEAKTQPNIEGNNPPTETAPKSTDAAKNSSTNVCYIPFMAFSLKEYEVYLDSFISLSPDFIHYDQLKTYGEFQDFVDVTDWQDYSNDADGRIKGNCSKYMYTLIDAEGRKITIYICPASEYSNEFLHADTLNETNALLSVMKEKTYYKYNDIYYAFRDGNLVQVLFPSGNDIIAISGSDFEPFKEYPIQKNPQIARLLDTQTAEAAVAEFNAKVAQARQDAQLEKAD